MNALDYFQQKYIQFTRFDLALSNRVGLNPFQGLAGEELTGAAIFWPIHPHYRANSCDLYIGKPHDIIGEDGSSHIFIEIKVVDRA